LPLHSRGLGSEVAPGRTDPMAGKRANKTKQTFPARAPAGKAARGDRDRLEQLERLIELMVARDVVEVELEEPGARWRVRRNEPHAVAYAAPAALAPIAMAAPGASSAPAQAASAGAAAEPQGEVFKSPMLGT